MLAVFLDLEASGLNPFQHRVLEIAFKIVDIATGTELISYQSIVKQPLEVWQKHDPNSISINGFTWEKVLEGKEEKEVEQQIIEIFTGYKIERGKAVYICQNPGFDRTFFAQLVDVYKQEKYNWPYHWLDFASMYWAILAKNRQAHGGKVSEIHLSKNTIAQHYHLPLEEHPHSAMNGVDHLILCYGQVIGFG